MDDLSRRSTRPELMDTESVSFEEFHECLHTLTIINTLTLAYRPTLRWVEHMMAGAGSGQSLSVIDIGCGGGDMLRRIWKWARERHFDLELIGVDLNPWSKKSAEQLTPKDAPIRYEATNVFSLDSSRRAHFIVSSLFAHHLSDHELIRFIRWMDGHAIRGWFINDLHRHPVPYLFIKCAGPLLISNRMNRHDGPVSVARAFTASEWRHLLEEAGIPPERTKIEWFFPFRYGVSCRKV